MNIPELLQPHVRQWIIDHEKDEPAQLMLQAHRFPDIPVREAVAQIQARQKVKHKLPAWYKQESLIYPPNLSVEQASSEATARYKADLLKKAASMEHRQMADLTGGMGVDSYYLSQHFEKAYYVEQQEILCQAAAHNFQALGATHIQVIHTSAENFIAQASSLDAIYLDPARRGQANEKLYKLADCQPDITGLLPQLFRISPTVLLKAAPMLDISQGLSELRHVVEVHVLALKNEVKELLFLMQQGFEGEATVVAVNLNSSLDVNVKAEAEAKVEAEAKAKTEAEAKTEDDDDDAEPEAEKVPLFRFYFSEEQVAEAVFAEPRTYLYEPHAALMKAGAFRLIAQRYQCFKLHPNSHLYTSDSFIPSFPGRCFRLLYAGKPDKKLISQYFPEKKALLSSRNHPLSVAQLSKKLGLKEGGMRYLIATTFKNNKPGILILDKVND